MRSSSNVVVALLSQCIMKIPGVFVNIDGGATRRPDEELNKQTAADLCRVPSICLDPDNPSRADINEMRRSEKHQKTTFSRLVLSFDGNFNNNYLYVCIFILWCWEFFFVKSFFKAGLCQRHYKSPFFADFLHVMDSSCSGKVDDLGPDTKLLYIWVYYFERIMMTMICCVFRFINQPFLT